ncbi:hypothetical protein CPB86DRAFT_816604 [Serendipita vermifera]|nr:hypothetical protein CPB86DRAFT_816604 [Serendipita vermifera]
MASISALPVEILLYIVKITFSMTSKEKWCEVGYDAAWNPPKESSIKSVLIQPSRPHTPISDILPYPDGLMDDNSSDTSEQDEQKSDFYTLFSSLRLVNRLFNQIVTPMLRRDMNLLIDDTVMTKFRNFVKENVVPQAQHIHSLYIQVHYTDPGSTSEMHDCAIDLLPVCTSLTSLSLYFQDTYYQPFPSAEDEANTRRLGRTIASLMEEGKLSTLGLYAKDMLLGDAEISNSYPFAKIIETVAGSEQARTRLKVLDLVLCPMSHQTYNQVLTRFPNLESLTIRSGLQRDHPRIWEVEERDKWMYCQSLTRLQFNCCENVYAPHVPQLVGALPNLRELLVSTCGNPTDIIIEQPLPGGWHTDPDALCNTHKPLDWFHVEHMDDWEIRTLGVIPTKTLILTTIKRDHFLNELKLDNHIFPGMRRLRLSPPSLSLDDEDIKKSQSMIDLENLCATREIEIMRDAKAIYHCGCAGPEGF